MLKTAGLVAGGLPVAGYVDRIRELSLVDIGCDHDRAGMKSNFALGA
jgi:hypothetical protein